MRAAQSGHGCCLHPGASVLSVVLSGLSGSAGPCAAPAALGHQGPSGTLCLRIRSIAVLSSHSVGKAAQQQATCGESCVSQANSTPAVLLLEVYSCCMRGLLGPRHRLRLQYWPPSLECGNPIMLLANLLLHAASLTPGAALAGGMSTFASAACSCTCCCAGAAEVWNLLLLARCGCSVPAYCCCHISAC